MHELQADAGLCPLCGDALSTKVDVRKGATRTFSGRCPNEGTYAIAPDLLAALPHLAAERVVRLRDYLRALNRVSDAPNILTLDLVHRL